MKNSIVNLIDKYSIPALIYSRFYLNGLNKSFFRLLRNTPPIPPPTKFWKNPPFCPYLYPPEVDELGHVCLVCNWSDSLFPVFY